MSLGPKRLERKSDGLISSLSMTHLLMHSSRHSYYKNGKRRLHIISRAQAPSPFTLYIPTNATGKGTREEMSDAQRNCNKPNLYKSLGMEAKYRSDSCCRDRSVLGLDESYIRSVQINTPGYFKSVLPVLTACAEIPIAWVDSILKDKLSICR